MADEAIRENARMPDARLVVAREYGFGSWARLREHLEALGGKREVRHPFETDLQYYRDRAAGMLSVFAHRRAQRDPARAAVSSGLRGGVRS